MKESQIEGRVGTYAKSKGVIFEKFVSPSKRSVPDRLLTFPNGIIIFIEFKAPGKKPTAKQYLDHERRRKNKALVFVVDDVDQGKQIIDRYLQLC